MKTCPRTYSLNEESFDILTDDSAYWIGVLLTDGNIYCGKGTAPVISLRLSGRDIEHIKKFRAFIGSTHPIYSRTSDDTVGIGISSRTMANSLREYGIVPSKTFVTKAPERLKYNRHFWRGVIDGDGCISLHRHSRKDDTSYLLPSIHLTGTYELCSQLRGFILSRHPEFKSHVSRRSSSKICQISFTGAVAIDIMQYLYTDCYTYLDRKYGKANSLLSQYGGSK